MKPDFSKLDLNLSSAKVTKEEWERKFKQETGKTPREFVWQTMEQIDVKPLYTKDDLKNLEL